MGSTHLGADLHLAWASAQIAVMGAQGAVRVLPRRTIAAAPEVEQSALREKLIQEYEDTLLNPYTAAERGYIDAVIMPSFFFRAEDRIRGLYVTGVQTCAFRSPAAGPSALKAAPL